MSVHSTIRNTEILFWFDNFRKKGAQEGLGLFVLIGTFDNITKNYIVYVDYLIFSDIFKCAFKDKKA